jgi:cytochrome c biogenesis factor
MNSDYDEWLPSQKETNMKSWKTSLAGVAAILTAVGAALTAAFDSDPATNVDIAVLMASVLAGVGLLMARDNDKSSESVGAK